ncbi:MAG: iron-regulated protein [Pseudazoarcus pumilus]|nr:iron-regulated protein [Pseudazoarcus pumilus]
MFVRSARGLLAAVAFSVATPVLAVEREAVVTHYADLAEAMYADSLAAARALQGAVKALVDGPSKTSLEQARQTWLAARVPYQQTEVYRFGNPVVDDWEGKVNAWPLDEGLIDYVDASYGTASDENPLYVANVIGNTEIRFGADVVDTSEITKELLTERLHEIGGVEANVATGYHAIEFLLWGQDLNGNGPGAGNRPWTDYAQGAQCTGGNCERRARYLEVATELLIDDLEWIVAQWAADGEARQAVTADPARGLSMALTGLGSLSYGELAGERMKLGLILGDPEEEHDCFSDNTHNSHYYDVVGMRAVYLGEYQRRDGTRLQGPSLSALTAAADTALDAEMRSRLDASLAALDAIRARAEAGEAYDQLIAAGNTAGNALIQAAIDALTVQTRSIERVVTALALQPIEIEGSDSLDNPEAVFQ